ncbi:hypothetical protein D3C74_236760 [compost metagenome]
MRRNFRRKSGRDPAGAIDQQVRKSCWQHHRLLRCVIEVVFERYGSFLNVAQQLHRDRRQASFGIPHCCRRVVVLRAPVAVAVDQRMTHFPRLRHPHHTLVNRRVPVRMIVPHDVPDGFGRLPVRLVRRIAGIVHRVQNPPLHRLQPVANIGNRPVLNNVFGIPAKAVAYNLFQKRRQKVFQHAHINSPSIPQTP